jgi:hypothetical protein
MSSLRWELTGDCKRESTYLLEKHHTGFSMLLPHHHQTEWTTSSRMDSHHHSMDGLEATCSFNFPPNATPDLPA